MLEVAGGILIAILVLIVIVFGLVGKANNS